jgi:hypothetical protein
MRQQALRYNPLAENMEMKHIYIEEGSRPIKVWTTDIEDEALTQARNLARLPFIAGNGVALMPIAMLAEAARWARLSPHTRPSSRLRALIICCRF